MDSAHTESVFRISERKLEEQDLKRGLAGTESGAYVAFEGWVRNENEGRRVTSLEYESCIPLAEQEGGRIMDEACERFDIVCAHCFHRVGHLALGEMAVWVGVVSAHRGDGFRACRYIIDEVKARLPIWKKEHYESGDSGWIGCPGEDGKG